MRIQVRPFLAKSKKLDPPKSILKAKTKWSSPKTSQFDTSLAQKTTPAEKKVTFSEVVKMLTYTPIEQDSEAKYPDHILFAALEPAFQKISERELKESLEKYCKDTTWFIRVLDRYPKIIRHKKQLDLAVAKGFSKRAEYSSYKKDALVAKARDLEYFAKAGYPKGASGEQERLIESLKSRLSLLRFSLMFEKDSLHPGGIQDTHKRHLKAFEILISNNLEFKQLDRVLKRLTLNEIHEDVAIFEDVLKEVARRYLDSLSSRDF